MVWTQAGNVINLNGGIHISTIYLFSYKQNLALYNEVILK